MFTKIINYIPISSKEFLKASQQGGPDNLLLIQRYIKQNNHNPAAFKVVDEHGNTALILAIKHKNESLFQFLLNVSASCINAVNEVGSTALIWAARHGFLPMVRDLISAGADVSIRNTRNYDAEGLAQEREYQNVVEFLQKSTLLQFLKKRNFLSIQDYLNKKNPFIINQLFKDYDFWISIVNTHQTGAESIKEKIKEACQRAFYRGDVAEIEQFLALESQSTLEFIEEHISATFHEYVSEFLIRKANQEFTQALVKHNFLIVERYLKLHKNEGPLTIEFFFLQQTMNYAAGLGVLSVIKILTEELHIPMSDIDPSAHPLILACSYGHFNVVSYLIQNDPTNVWLNRQNDRGETGLIHAAAHGYFDIVQLLLQRSGIDIHIKTHLGQTAQTLAEHRYPRISYLVQAAGLLDAAKQGNLHIVQHYVSNNPTILNCMDEQGNTALSLAAGHGHLEVVHYLIESYSDFTVLNQALLKAQTDARLQNQQTILYYLQGAAFLWAAEHGELYISIVGQYLTDNSANPEALNTTTPKLDTALHKAASKGHLSMVEVLVTSEISVNACNAMGYTALMEASRNGHLEVVKVLLQLSNIDIYIKLPDGLTALTLAGSYNNNEIAYLIQSKELQDASASGNLEIVQKYLNLNQPSIINGTNSEGDTACMIALKHGHLKVVGDFLNHDLTELDFINNSLLTLGDLARHLGHENIFQLVQQAKFLKSASNGNLQFIEEYLVGNQMNQAAINVTNPYGNTALILAVCNRQVSVLEVLLKSKIAVNAANQFGDTAIIWAACNGDLETVRLLLQAPDIDIHKANKEGFNALQHAKQKNYPEILKLLQLTALHQAIKTKNPEAIKNILESDPELMNEADQEGDTPLILAARYRKIVVIGFLIHSNKVNLWHTNKAGMSAEAVAQERGYKDITIFLQKESLFRATEQENLAEVQRILRANPQAVFEVDSEKNSAFHLAASKGYPSIVQAFMELSNLDIDAVNKAGETALMKAAYFDHFDVVRILIEAGADSSIKKPLQYNAEQLAFIKDNQSIVQLLKTARELLQAIENDAVENLNALLKSMTFSILTPWGDKARVLAVDKSRIIEALNQQAANELIVAARTGNLKIIQQYMERNYLPKTIHDAYNNSLLIIAAIFGHFHVVKWLATTPGISLHASSIYGDTALSWSATLGHLEITEFLIQIGLNIHHKNKNQLTPEEGAAKNNHHSVLQLFQSIKDFLHAAEIGNGALVQEYLDRHKMDGFVFCTKTNGDNALTLAARGGHLSLVKTLLKYGFDSNLEAAENAAKSNQHLIILASLQQQIAAMKRIGAINEDRISADEINSSHINAINSLGDSALTVAARAGNAYLIEALLECKADPYLKNYKGMAPAQVAEQQGHTKIVILLQTRMILSAIREKGIKSLSIFIAHYQQNPQVLNRADNWGNTALLLAAKLGDLEKVRLLIEAGADYKLKNQIGRNAEQEARLSGHEETADFLSIQDSLKHRRSQNLNFEERLRGIPCDSSKYWDPITYAVMDDPITIDFQDNFPPETFERQSLRQYFAQNGNTGTIESPLTQRIIHQSFLKQETNWNLQKTIKEFVETAEEQFELNLAKQRREKFPKELEHKSEPNPIKEWLKQGLMYFTNQERHSTPTQCLEFKSETLG